MGACAFLIHPPVTMGARTGSTDALTQKSTHAGAYTLALALRQERTSTHIRSAKLARTHAQQRAHVCGKRNLSPLRHSLSRASHPFSLSLQDVRHCVSRAETVAGRARSAESRYEIYGTLRGDTAIGLKIYSRLHVLVNSITNMADSSGEGEPRDFF